MRSFILIACCLISVLEIYSQNLDLNWDTSSVVECSESSRIQVLEFGTVLVVSGYTGSNCSACTTLDANSNCIDKDGENNCALDVVNVISSNDVCTFSSYSIQARLRSRSINRFSTCSDSELAILRIESTSKGLLGLVEITDSDQTQEIVLEDFVPDENESIQLDFSFKSNSPETSFVLDVNFRYIEDPENSHECISAAGESVINSDYPWLNEAYTDCSDLEFEEFNNGAFAYIYVSDGTLFFQDGVVYCRDRQDVSCKTLYNLPAAPSAIWSCDGLNNETDGETNDENEDGNEDGNDNEIIDENEDEINDSPQQIELTISENEAPLKVGETFCIEMKVADLKNVLSFQFQFELSNRNLQFLDYDTDLQNVTVLQEDNIIKVIWFSEQLIAIDLNEEINILRLCFLVIDNVDGQTNLSLLNTSRLFSQFVTEGTSGDFIENTDLIVNGGNLKIEETMMSEEEENEELSIGLPIDEYSWMISAAQDFGCADLTVTEYDFEAYSFFYFSNADNGILYYEDGTFYCRDGANTDCKELYALGDELISNTWSCETGDSPSENNSGIPESLEAEYPWITDVFNCTNNSTVTEFESSIFKFIYIEPQGSLYFQDGTFYCQDSENRACPELYDLTSMTNQWNCNAALIPDYDNFNSQQNRRQDITVYPNPSTGKYFISKSQDIISINVFDVNGRIVLQSFNNKIKHLEFDLSHLDDGIYFLKIKSSDSVFVNRVIKSN